LRLSREADSPDKSIYSESRQFEENMILDCNRITYFSSYLSKIKISIRDELIFS